MKKTIQIAALLLALCLLMCGCKKKDPYADIPNPVATITLANGSVMQFELFLSDAPNTVANFVELSNAGFYDGLPFHRVVPGVLIQSGDPAGDGTGGPDWTIKGEFKQNGFDNPLKHTRGVLSMARTNDPNSASSQFFIMHAPAPYLDGQYAGFGKVIEGDEVIDAIANVETGNYGFYMQDVPVEAVVIETVELLPEV